MIEILNTTLWEGITVKAIISIFIFILLFLILITEKIEKAVISILLASVLVILQVFSEPWSNSSSQYEAAYYIYKNLDIFAFIIWMMIISGIIKDTWFFDFLAIRLVKKIKWHPILLFVVLSYLSFLMTIFMSNIPTIIILSPLVLIITKKLKLSPIPYIFGIITFANLGWAVTPISDPTTYYQATTLWFTFWQVVSNTGFIMFIVSIISFIYLFFVFRKKININNVNIDFIKNINPYKYISDKNWATISLFILFLVILLVIFKEYIYNKFWIKLENWWIAIFWGFVLVLFLSKDIHDVLKSKIDYATLFFFAGLFVIVWALEHNGIIEKIAKLLISITWWNEVSLLAIITMGSALLSVFIDNIPYNITMVSTLEQFKEIWFLSSSAWFALAWWLNSCTSIWWAWSPIGAACNVIALSNAERNWIFIWFLKYLIIAVPLVLLNSFTAFSILYFKYIF